MEYLVWVLVAMLANSLLAPLVSFITEDIPASATLFLATASFLTITLIILLLTGSTNPGYLVSPSAGMVYVAGFFLTVGILSYFTALEYGPVSVVVPIFGMFIVGSSILGIALLGEEMSITRGLGIVFAFLAIYLSGSGGE